MDSKPFGSLSSIPREPILLAQAQQQPNSFSNPSSSLSGSLPIRAPITVDDDDGSDFESYGDKFDKSSYGSSVNGSDSGSESEVFVNGEESETAFEKELVAEPDEETVGVSGAVEKYKLSRPSVAYPDEESSENGGVGGEEEDSGEVDGYEPAVVRPVMVDELSLKLVRPIAQLSLDDDDSVLTSDEEVVSEVEDGVSLETVSIAPRIKVLGVDEGEEDETVVGEANDDSLSDDYVGDDNVGVNEEKLLGVDEGEEDETIVGEANDDHSLSDDYVGDDNVGVNEEKLLGVDEGEEDETIVGEANDDSLSEDYVGDENGILGVNEEKLLGVGDYVEDVKEQRTEPDVEVENSVGEKQKLDEMVEEAVELNFMNSRNQKIEDSGENDAYSSSLRLSLGVSEGIDDVLKEQNGVTHGDHEETHEPITNILKETRESNSIESNVDGWELKYVAEETVVSANSVSNSVNFSGEASDDSLSDDSVGDENRILGVNEGEEDETVVREANDDSLSDDSVGDENGILGVNEEKLLGVGDHVEDVKEQRTEPDVEVENSVGEKQKLDEMVEEAIELNFMNSQNQKIEDSGENDAYSTSLRLSLGVSEGIDDVLKRTTVVSDSELLKEQNGVPHGDHEETHEPITNILKETRESNSMESNVDGWEVKYVAEETVVCANSLSNSINFSGGVDNGDLTKTSDSDRFENSLNCDYGSLKSVNQSSNLAHEMNVDAQLEEDHGVDAIEEEQDGLLLDEDTEDFIDSSETAKQIINDLGQTLGSSSLFGTQGSEDHLKSVDGPISMDLDDVEIGQDSKGNKLFDSTSMLALLKAASSIDESRGFALDGPAELGSFPHSARPAPLLGESEDNVSEEDKRKIEKMQLLRVKFLRLVHRLGLSPEDSTVSQVLCKLVLAAGRHSSQLCSLESAQRMALELEAENKSNLDLCPNILVIGKTGVGKSATINSIFGEKKVMIDAFQPATTTVKEIVGKMNGVKIRIIDTPGLKSSAVEQAVNRKILAAIRKCIKKFPPDVVLYVDRLDTQTRSINDLPLLRTITESLSSSIWRNAVVTLTHAASVPPDGPSGFPLNYEVFVAQRSHVVLQSIGLAVSGLHVMNPNVVQPVSLIENRPLHGKGEKRERLISDGVSGSSQLLLLCYSIKILSEASSISKPQDSSNRKKVFGFRNRSLPLPYLLTSLMQSRVHPKLSADQGGNNIDSDIELGDVLDADSEDEDEYDQLPPFRPLRRSQIAKLSKEQRKAYLEEYDYRVKLLQKKMWREEISRLKEIKDKSKDARDVYGFNGEDGDKEESGPEDESIALLDMPLPPSFDGDNPAYRYRFLEPTSQLLVRPVVDTNGWDHDCGYDGVSIDRNLAVGGKIPAVFAIQITKDKKQFNIHWDSSVSVKHGENGSTMAGLDIQTVGKQLAYILSGETKVKNFKINRTTAGITVTFLGEQMATGLKIGDQIAIGKHLVLAGGAGVVRSQGDTAYGANLELRLKEEDFPIEQNQSSLGLSLMKWRGDLALTVALQSQLSIGRSSKMAVHVGLNKQRSGQITVRTSSSDQLQIALAGILPIAVSIFRSFCPGFGAQHSTN